MADVFVKLLETGDVYSGPAADAKAMLDSGRAVIATQADVEQARERTRAERASKGVGSELMATGAAVLRGAVPFIGDDIAAAVGYGGDAEQKQLMQAHPTLSTVGEVAGFAASMPLGSGATNIAGKAAARLAPAFVTARAAKGMQALERVSQAVRSAEEANFVTRSIGLGLRGAAQGVRAEISTLESDRILYGERDAATIADEMLSAAKAGAVINLLAGTTGGVLRRMEDRRFAAAERKLGQQAQQYGAEVEKRREQVSKKATFLNREADKVFAKLDPLEQPQAHAMLRRAKEMVRAGAELDDVGSMVQMRMELSIIRSEAARSAVMAQVSKAIRNEVVRREIATSALAPMAAKAGQAGVGSLLDSFSGTVIKGALAGQFFGGMTGAVGGAGLLLAKRYIAPLIAPAVSGTAMAATSGVSRMALASIPAFVDEDSYHSVRESFTDAPPPELQVRELIQAGVPGREASRIVAGRKVIHDEILKAMPPVQSTNRSAYAAANRFLDAIVNPKRSLERLRRAQPTPEDVMILRASDPEALALLQATIKAQYQGVNARRQFTTTQRAAHEVILGHSIGIDGATLMRVAKQVMQEREQRTQSARGGQFSQLVNPELKRQTL